MFPFMHLRMRCGTFALVDCLDYELVAGYSWNAANGYVTAKRDGKHIAMHRLVMDAKPGELVDHINGSPLDNRRANLRTVTATENSWNSRQRPGRRYPRGVSRVGGIFMARIMVRGKNHYLGTFESVDAAAAAYSKASLAMHGEHSGFARP